jgi:DNA-binding transcriptional ArsR family regulator
MSTHRLRSYSPSLYDVTAAPAEAFPSRRASHEPDPLIHDPWRLRIVATLAALADGDAICVTRLQDMIGLTPGSLITRLRELGRAGYVRTGKTGDEAPATATLTREGRAALDRYTAVLPHLLQVAREDRQAPAPGVRAGDTDRDAAAAALGEHFA